MSKHTPGPWNIDKDDSGNGVSANVNGSRYWITGVIQEPGKEFSDEANARLIAAAPDLLEALQNIVESGLSTSRISAARAAIAKATGEQK